MLESVLVFFLSGPGANLGGLLSSHTCFLPVDRQRKGLGQAG